MQYTTELFEITRQITELVAETTQQTTESLAGISTTQGTTLGLYTMMKEWTTELPGESTTGFITEMERNDSETTHMNLTTVKETSHGKTFQLQAYK